MGAEKELTPGGHDKDATHVVQATDALGRTVSRDAFKSEAEAEAQAEKLRRLGHAVDVSRLAPVPGNPSVPGDRA